MVCRLEFFFKIETSDNRNVNMMIRQTCTRYGRFHLFDGIHSICPIIGSTLSNAQWVRICLVEAK